ncbi:hypothetical protein HDU98_004115 [Podochytrium sp. JEL0797]|nr:hypothetical protein HDU98_004115 [Podochytrium sp. JEL0797]
MPRDYMVHPIPFSSFSHHRSQSDDEDPDSQLHYQKGKPGRKTIPGIPKDKRVAQNRKAQRAFRERKDAYLHSVEEKVREGHARISELTAQNDQLQHENAMLRQSVTIDMINDATLVSSNLDISDLNMDFSSHLAAEEPSFSEMLAMSPLSVSSLQEPCSVYTDLLLITDVMRTELKAIHSLQNSPHVDELIKVRLEIDTMTDPDFRGRQFLRFESTKFKLMDASTLLERKEIINIVELFRSKHQVVLPLPSITPTSCLVSPKPLNSYPPTGMKTRMDLSFTQELLQIQSLNGAKELVERFVGECYSWEGFGRERGPKEAYDYLLGCYHLVKMLANLCDDDDLIKFYLALEVTRAANKQIWDTLYQEALEF